MPFPPPPATNINWNKLGIAVNDSVNGHAESHYSINTGEWSDPEFVQDPYLRIHGLSPALNYGQQAYEGMKAYRDTEGQINLFRPDIHASRMAHSASFVSMPPISKSHFLRCVELAVAQNAAFVPPNDTEALLYIRPLLFGSSPQLGLSPPEEYTFAVYVQPGTTYHGVRPLDALILEEVDRAAPLGTGSAKVGGNYAPMMRWTDRARTEGYGITLHLDSKTHTEIEEFSTSGFIGVKTSGKEGENVTLVVPDSKNVIQSITSDSCVEIAKSFGWGVEIRPVSCSPLIMMPLQLWPASLTFPAAQILYAELATFSEVIAVGTAAALLPIKSITRKSMDENFSYRSETGPCTIKLGAMLKDVMKGRAEDQWGWLSRVEEISQCQTGDGPLIIGNGVKVAVNGR
ncbi:MAG: putative secondary metabolism biosynthetic enzyme [Sclerophora amabilis]|nr:MAG: putative secondary metabolism biosynthetic enzyme [Sclerophora amabilis]